MSHLRYSKETMKRLLVVLGICLLVGGQLVGSAKAVEYGGVGGRPAQPRADNPRSKSIFIYTLKAGQSTSDGVRIVNNTPKTRTISVYPVDAVLASGGTFSCAQAAEQAKDVGSWITLSKNTVTVKANSNVVVPFTVTVPLKVDVGEHDGCIAIQEASQANASDKSGVVLSFRSAIRMAVTIPGKIVKKLSITNISTQPGNNNTVVITPAVRNEGNVSLDTTIRSSLQPLVGVGSVDTTGTYPILPRSSASWNLELKRPFWGGWYRATVAATYNSDPASSLGSKNGMRTTVRKTSHVLFVAPAPLALVIELLIILVIIGLIAWVLRRRRQYHHVRTRWSNYKVNDGDTIMVVARRHHVSWKRLARANKLRAPYHLEAGQTLRVPPTIKE
jgi:hypothetical protein